MKKIRPLARYDQDQQYPSTGEFETEAWSGRRTFLKGLLAGAAALSTGLWLGSEAQAQAQPQPRPTPLPPGVPPRPDKGPRPRPEGKPSLPGGGPQPNQRLTKLPCTPPTTVKLDARFAFCGDRNAELHVTTTDPQVARMLKKSGEGRRLASVVKPILTQEKSCDWLEDTRRKAQMETRLAEGLTLAYQQSLGGALEPLKVRLIVHERYTTPGVIPMPRPRGKRGCASCSTDASVENVLIPVGLATLALLARKGRSE